jgi:hypothetical protein
VRLRAVVISLFYAFAPYWVYEDFPHYSPEWNYFDHMKANLARAWAWITHNETEYDVWFEEAVNEKWQMR